MLIFLYMISSIKQPYIEGIIDKWLVDWLSYTSIHFLLKAVSVL